MTQRAGQAFNVMASTSNLELYSYDGVVAVVSNEISSNDFCLMIVVINKLWAIQLISYRELVIINFLQGIVRVMCMCRFHTI